jgi:hypothetical protein
LAGIATFFPASWASDLIEEFFATIRPYRPGLSRPGVAELVDAITTVLTFSPSALKNPLSCAICTVTSSEASSSPTVTFRSSGPLDAPLDVPPVLDEPEPHAARPRVRVSVAVARASHIRWIRGPLVMMTFLNISQHAGHNNHQR